jgi:fatty acid desaturase
METLLTFLIYALIAAVAIGAIAAAWWAVIEGIWPLLWLMAVLVLFVFILVVGVTVDAERPTITIKKADWTCTQAVKRSSTTYVQTGQVMNPITTSYDDCVQYTRIAR